MMMLWKGFVWALFLITGLAEGQKLLCGSPQFLELGRAGIITCDIDDHFFGVYWYNTSDSTNNLPMLSREESRNAGELYPSSEFQISSSGSLAITNVTLQHEHTFRVVIIFDKAKKIIQREDIKIIVMIKPPQDYPVIDKCGSQRACVVNLGNVDGFLCSVQRARPKAHIKWSLRTFNSDKDLPLQMEVESEGNVFTSTVSFLRVPYNSTNLLVCKLFHHPQLLAFRESYVFLYNGIKNYSFETIKEVKLRLNSQMHLNCEPQKGSFLIWEKEVSKNRFHLVALTIFSYDNYSESLVDKYLITQNGSLIINDVDATDEGIFICSFNGNPTNDSQLLKVSVIALPKPSFPLVEGCGNKRFCSLTVQKEGTLTCTLNGIRPILQLQFAFKQNSGEDVALELLNETLLTDENDNGTFNVTLTAYYVFKDTSPKKITVVCMTRESEATFSTFVDLHCTNDIADNSSFPTASTSSSSHRLYIPLIVTGLAGMLALGITVVLVRWKVKKQESKKSEKEHGEDKPFIPMTTRTRTQTEELFRRQLQYKYEQQYESIRPIPYVRNKMFSVGRIFVETSIKLNMRDNSPNSAEKLKPLNNYYDLFNNKEKCNRFIIQGDAGYGKSTLTLRMAYDWCNEEIQSPLRHKDIFIALKLRQLGGLSSIYKAIKLLLLPKDTELSEEDVKHVLQSDLSVVVVLDGFDEYPKQDQNESSDVMSIIQGDMFQDKLVILFTRPSSLPTAYHPLTRFAHLDGFDKTAQQKYLDSISHENSGTKHDTLRVTTDVIQKRLLNNPLIQDVCQIPMFFVMFAHIAQDNEDFQNVSSVTTFFDYIMMCCHGHLQMKLRENEREKVSNFYDNHKKLDRLAFERLTTSNDIRWEKEDLLSQIERELYDYFIELGVLYEEVLHNNIQLPKKCQKYVCFYHKVMCEWYAAHHLALLAKDKNFLELKEILAHTNIFDVQYLLRFSCGLNIQAAQKLLQCLDAVRGGAELAILCTLERTKDFKSISSSVHTLCKNEIFLRGNDNRVLQRSTINLMVLASLNRIKISSLWLKNCYQYADTSSIYLRLRSGLEVPKLDTLSCIHIQSEEISFEIQEITDVIIYALESSMLEEIWFHSCILPKSFKREQVLNSIKDRNVKVVWTPTTFGKFHLDYSGFWKDTDENEMDDSTYETQLKMVLAPKQEISTF